MQSIESLANAAAAIMMRGAVEFLRSPHIGSADVDLDAVVAELKARAPAAIDAATKDAREALEVPGMEAIADATFAATMRLAGIEAAKAVLRNTMCSVRSQAK